jgi:LacI family transcriptional regulator
MKPVTVAVTEMKPPYSKRPTITDIAAIAGVSKTTVSRVLNNKPDIAPETRAKITAIIEQLEYTPHAMATYLAKGRTGLIGLLMPALSWPWVLEVVRGAAEALEESSYELVIFTASSTVRMKKIFEDMLPTGLVGGMIIILPPKDLKEIKANYRAGYPLVVIDDRAPHSGVPWIDADSRQGIYEAIQHLTNLGHSRIAYLGGLKEWFCSVERMEAYRQALNTMGIPVDEALILPGNFTEEAGIQAVERWWGLKQPPTAILTANDIMALGALRELERKGLRVPQDVSVVGFDDLPLAEHAVPALTTVRQPIREMGRKAAEMVTTLIEGRNLSPVRMRLETTLVVRSSTMGRKGEMRDASSNGHAPAVLNVES